MLQIRENDDTGKQKKRFFTTLDGLRGIVALCIAVRHAPHMWEPHISPDKFFRESYLGVDFFFVLSGFVLSFAYQEKLLTDMRVSEFAAVRIIRLYPLYAISVLLSLPNIIWLGIKFNASYLETISSILLTLLMIPNPIFNYILFPYNVAVWSLFFENISNVVFACFPSLLKMRILIVYLIFSAAFLSLSVVNKWFGFNSITGPLDAGMTWETFGAGLVRVMYSFFAGVFVFHMHKRKIMCIRINPVAIVILLLGALVSYPSADMAIIFDLICVIFIFPLIVLLGSYSTPSNRLSKIFEFLGNVSYGVYVLQIPVYVISRAVLSRLMGEGDGTYMMIVGPLSLTILVIISAITFYRYDLPIRSWISYKYKTSTASSRGLRQSNAGGG